ncbi:MAG: hypothetical protein R3F49_13870 [Planctomycetota bacterium]
MSNPSAALTLSALAAMTFLAPASHAQAPPEEIPFDELARAFREQRCAGGAACTVPEILERKFVHVGLGAFEVHYPTEHLAQRAAPEDLVDVALGLLDFQRVWIQWVMPSDANAAAVQADIAALRAWVEAWPVRALGKLGKEADHGDLEDLCAATPELRAAEARVLAYLRSDASGLPFPEERRVQIILSPTRRDFMRWVAFAGQLSEDKRKELYSYGVDQWTQFWTGWSLVAAMEYASWNGFDPTFAEGKSMKSIQPTGIVEQVTLQAGMAFLKFCLNRDLDHYDNALVMNIVIEFVGSINTIDGEGQLKESGGKTQPYSKFVPGGNPNGGTLPPRSAQGQSMVVRSPYRKGDGKDHFFGPLHRGQREGAKDAVKQKAPRYKDALCHFLLKADSGKCVVNAPFFGVAAALQQYPAQEFLTEYGEFYRAYKSGFHHWLRTAGDPASPEASAAKFRQLMHSLDDLRDGKTFEQLAEEIYGVPLSAKDNTTDSLEWRFLAFLDKVK